ncbi:conserved exported hypothetical protein [Burkholderiales bacterium 8X]|nr:conserved exported hypothetical protein [Burkholderiales bacterium 8X]
MGLRATFRSLRLACALAAAAPLLLCGCSSLLAESGSAAAGIAGTSIAGAVTDSAAAATGIGIGVQSAARAGVQYGQRRIHDQTQRQLSATAGPLAVGKQAAWRTKPSVPLEREEQGQVTVSRIISSGALACKEIVFSVESPKGEEARFYVASICRQGRDWVWASAEPATARWGALQ